MTSKLEEVLLFFLDRAHALFVSDKNFLCAMFMVYARDFKIQGINLPKNKIKLMNFIFRTLYQMQEKELINKDLIPQREAQDLAEEEKEKLLTAIFRLLIDNYDNQNIDLYAALRGK